MRSTLPEINSDYAAGVDEVGRGPLAGPVVAAAVILDPSNIPPGLADSKKLSAKKRESLNTQIREQSLSFAIAEASIAEIDELNILQASLLAMQRAVAGLQRAPRRVHVDGNQLIAFEHGSLAIEAQAFVGGDSLLAEISAASIIAKVHRDLYMARLDEQYPGYGFARNKGYGTREHREALVRLGLSPAHRCSFEPAKSLLAARVA